MLLLVRCGMRQARLQKVQRADRVAWCGAPGSGGCVVLSAVSSQLAHQTAARGSTSCSVRYSAALAPVKKASRMRRRLGGLVFVG